MTSFPRDRYNAEEFLRGYDNSPLQMDGNTWCVSFQITRPEADELAFWFPGTDKPDERKIRLGREICEKISQLDNLVQESFETEYLTYKHDVTNYDLYLAYIEITDSTASLEYFGTIVNTQWTSVFTRTVSGVWVRENF
jgi:hypothetical protein